MPYLDHSQKKYAPFKEEIKAHVRIVNAEVVMSSEKEKNDLDATRDG